MERKAFLKLIGLGAVAAAVAPEIILSAPMSEPKQNITGGIYQHMLETRAGLHPFEPSPYKMPDFHVYIGPDTYAAILNAQKEMISTMSGIPDEILFGRKPKTKKK